MVLTADEVLEIARKGLEAAKIRRREREEEAEENWRLYRCDYSAENKTKDEWQSKGYFPIFTEIVNRQVEMLVRSFTDASKRLFEYPIDQVEMAAAIRDLIMQVFARNQLDEWLEVAIRQCELTGYAVCKDRWDTRENRVVLSLLDPLDIYKYPDRMGGEVIIEAAVMEKGELELLKDLPSYDSRAITEALDQKSGDQTDTEADRLRAYEKGIPERSLRHFVKPVTLYEFWGRFYGPDGSLAEFEDAGGNKTEKRQPVTFTICADRLIRPPIANFYIDDKPPYTIGSFQKSPPGTYPAARLTHHAILQRGHTRSINRVADKLSMGMKQLAIDATRVRSADIKGGMREAKIWRYRFPGKTPIEVLDLSSDLRDDYTFIAYLERALQSAGYTETMFGQPSTRGRPTLGEHELRQSATLAHISALAKVFETTFIEGLVSRVKTHLFQYQLDPTINPNMESDLIGVIDDPETMTRLISLTAAERERLATVDFGKANVRGMSEILGRAERMQGLTYFTRMITGLLQAVKGTQQEQQLHLDLNGLIYEIGEAVGINPRRLLGAEVEGQARDALLPERAPSLPERAAMGAITMGYSPQQQVAETPQQTPGGF